ncbi:MAG: DUF5678 domain-containing protein, partial [Dehalococcoidia bacterium]
LTEKSKRLYKKYVLPLESKHYGEYIAVSTDGRIVFAKTLVEVMQQAEHDLGSGNFVFKVGDIAVGKWL